MILQKDILKEHRKYRKYSYTLGKQIQILLV